MKKQTEKEAKKTAKAKAKFCLFVFLLSR